MTIHSLGLSGVMALRNQILERSQTLAAAHVKKPTPPKGMEAFSNALSSALKAVNNLQAQSSQQAAAWERGDNQDIATVMLSRQKAAIAFEATVQARNRLLSAYRDIMNMPV